LQPVATAKEADDGNVDRLLNSAVIRPVLPLGADLARRTQAHEVHHYFEPIAGYREMANGVSFVWHSTHWRHPGVGPLVFLEPVGSRRRSLSDWKDQDFMADNLSSYRAKRDVKTTGEQSGEVEVRLSNFGLSNRSVVVGI
jgi:hypothetical protein